ncbi:DUF1028 domain-containing protein [Enterobacter sp. Ap-916]|uniref:DUF1028 domain-containing protein n=1 Tax=Enterobacteriaceae TaxID=543 RepID=UPI0014207B36|nr:MULTISPECIES: DUF1028 domain-containing protein [unclassified Enterobacter]NIF57376.1 DUF1028 domain-containing protein [Enterobacter sp. Ap-867]NIG28682.1 DUF1028 domain-containing protein [Enterobacter sp. Ap-916]
MTFSIAARCRDTGQLGIAISSSSIAVGARCPWLVPGVGAVSSQNITLPALGPMVLSKLGEGATPQEALKLVASEHLHGDYRQVTVIDSNGKTACHSGINSLGIYHAVEGDNCVAAGNMLADTSVINAMIERFEQCPGPLADRLMTALEAALEKGGEAGPVHSAALKVVDTVAWPVVDLRVDWADDNPIAALHSLWLAYKPQMQDYLIRALDPREAPSYGVPGDE